MAPMCWLNSPLLLHLTTFLLFEHLTSFHVLHPARRKLNTLDFIMRTLFLFFIHLTASTLALNLRPKLSWINFLFLSGFSTSRLDLLIATHLSELEEIRFLIHPLPIQMPLFRRFNRRKRLLPPCETRLSL